jgi:thiosulfate dehydrogenase (quinone) large subunit
VPRVPSMAGQETLWGYPVRIYTWIGHRPPSHPFRHHLGVHAWFKWQLGFISGFAGFLSAAQDGQLLLLHHWIVFVFWTNTVGIDPTLFAYATALAETAVAMAFIAGAFNNLAGVVGILLSMAIWTTAEGFRGSYGAGSTDIGAAILYPLVFAGLFLSSAGLYYDIDRKLTSALGRFGYLASGSFARRPKTTTGRTLAMTL